MPIEVFCDSCQKKLRVPDTAAGKRIKCPKCQGVISVPAAEGAAPASASSAAIPTPSKLAASKSSGSIPVPAMKSSAAIAKTPVTPKSGVGKRPGESWFVQTEDGQQYGPVTRQELDGWYTEGRLTVDSQILKEGGTQWQWASDLYPDLAPQQDQAPAAEPGLPDFGAMGGHGSGGFALKTGDGGGGATPAASANPYASPSAAASRGVKGKKGGRGKAKGGSVQIDYVAYAFYAIGAMSIVICLTIMGIFMAGGSAISKVKGTKEDRAAAAAVANAMATTSIVGGLVGIAFSSLYFLVGYGLQQRAGWGRIGALIFGALMLLQIPLGTAVGIWCFMVLLDKDNAAAFK